MGWVDIMGLPKCPRRPGAALINPGGEQKTTAQCIPLRARRPRSTNLINSILASYSSIILIFSILNFSSKMTNNIEKTPPKKLPLLEVPAVHWLAGLHS